jgi:hypothetical protein
MTLPPQLPARYIEARNALAECLRVDEAKNIRDKAPALEVYAYQAKDAQLAGDAAEIKNRATRKIGELINGVRAVPNNPAILSSSHPGSRRS